MLIDFYNATSASKKFEIVYISSDKTVDDFEGYVSFSSSSYILCVTIPVSVEKILSVRTISHFFINFIQ